MSQTVFADGRGIAHQGSGGSSTVFPDTCNTPSESGENPIPYTNVGESSNTSGGPVTVTCDGEMPMVLGAVYSETSGDEAGSLGGVVSGTVSGEAEFITSSPDVFFEGEAVCRLGDTMFQNGENATG